MIRTISWTAGHLVSFHPVSSIRLRSWHLVQSNTDTDTPGMDGASGAIAVISLTLQLVQAGERISRYIKSVQDAPSDILGLVKSLDKLTTTLYVVRSLLEQHYSVLRLPGSPFLIIRNLEDCKSVIEALENIASKINKALEHKNPVKRSLATVTWPLKKEQIQAVQYQLHDAESGMQTAIMCNSWQLQYMCSFTALWVLLIAVEDASAKHCEISQLTSGGI